MTLVICFIAFLLYATPSSFLALFSNFQYQEIVITVPTVLLVFFSFASLSFSLLSNLLSFVGRPRLLVNFDGLAVSLQLAVV